MLIGAESVILTVSDWIPDLYASSLLSPILVNVWAFAYLQPSIIIFLAPVVENFISISYLGASNPRSNS